MTPCPPMFVFDIIKIAHKLVLLLYQIPFWHHKPLLEQSQKCLLLPVLSNPAHCPHHGQRKWSGPAVSLLSLLKH